MAFGHTSPSALHEGLLLIGGQSTRFLPDKMQERLAGKALHRHGLDALSTCCDVIWVSTGTARTFDTPDREGDVSVRSVMDQRPGQGPLEGIRSVMLLSRADHLLVLAGDLPHIQPTTLMRLLGAPAADVVCARDASNGQLQPLCARWSTSLLDPLTHSLASGRRGVQRFLADHHVLMVDVPSEELLNVNRPSDLPGGVSR